MEQQPFEHGHLDDLYAAATVGELRRLVAEIEEGVVSGQHLAVIGSLQVVAARAEDLATLCQRGLQAELHAALTDDSEWEEEL